MTTQLQDALKRTPLFEEHLKLGARMTPFGGWDMPLQYSGILDETLHTRKSITAFDTCHMGEFLVKGDAAGSGLEKVFAIAISDIALNSCRYGTMLNEKGGIIDDLIVYRLAADEWLIVVNAADIEKDAGHIRGNINGKASFEDRSTKSGKIDIQGPFSQDVTAGIFGPGVKRLAYYAFDRFRLFGEDMIVSRTGYTGELGYEVYCSPENIVKVWRAVLSDRCARPAGLGSRDILRLEMCYSLYGMDIDESTTPFEAGLEKYVASGKDFIGREALIRQKKEGLRRKRAFFMTNSRRSPRHGYTIYDGQKKIGAVTSGTFSPSLQKGIGMGFVTPGFEAAGRKITLRSGSIEIEAETVKRPFYKNGSLLK